MLGNPSINFSLNTILYSQFAEKVSQTAYFRPSVRGGGPLAPISHMSGSEIIVNISGHKATHFSLQIWTEKDSCSPAQPQYQAESRGENAKIATGRLKKTFRPCQSKFSCWRQHVGIE